ncbi:MAG: hypothetical protein HKP32_09180 [Woeseia sp.]|nr:hypothetical protein [Woeseia sp.]NNL55311.1 hypothetical protein [Woeseia sp.]
MSSSVSGDGRRTLVYVHGRQCQPAPEALLDLMLSALTTGIERDYPENLPDFRSINKRLAYYGDHVNAFLQERGEHYDEQLDLGDCRNALQQLAALDKRKKFGLTSYDKLPGKSAVPELAADLAAPVLGSIGLGGKLIGKVVPELVEYWSKDGKFAKSLRSAVRAAICEALRSKEQLLLISHGTGNVIAWDVLWELTHDPAYEEFFDSKIDTWVSLGSPLGDSTVQSKLLGSRQKGRRKFPHNVVSWHNVAAEDDWLCHDNTLADDFKGMLRQKMVSAIRDYRIYNLSVRYGKSDPHCALGYLIHPRTTQIIVDWITRVDLEPPPKHIF